MGEIPRDGHRQAIGRRPARARASITVTVDDDGPGLSKTERKAAVQRGKRLDETKPGSGLGLSIVADLAHLYRGELRAGRLAGEGIEGKAAASSGLIWA